MNGIVVIDKPVDLTSAKAVAKVKRTLGAEKVGHTGTLDPFATGVLVCCLGKATRLARFFLHGDKTYEAEMVLGVSTDTQDLTGKVVAEAPAPALSEQDILEVFARFKGRRMQDPPVYSALKHHGVPLYKLARKGKPVQNPPREIHIHSLDLLSHSPGRIRFSTTCSGGTYVRTLCADMGEDIGCGGHLASLRRTQNSGFSLMEALSLEELAEKAGQEAVEEILVPMADALRRMPEVRAGKSIKQKIAHGEALTWHDLGGPRNIPDAPTEREPGRDQPEESPANHHIKVVDDRGDLLAVLSPGEDGMGLSYCCVFSGSK